MSTIGSDTPSTSRDLALVDDHNGLVLHHDARKVLEEDEYLGRMAHIIKRDFFSGSEIYNDEEVPSGSHESVRSSVSHLETPGTDRTEISSTSSLRSRKEACSTRLNEFLSKYTSEDNAYFEKLQAKELKRHKLRFPWLYKNREQDKDRAREHDSKTSLASITFDGSRTSICRTHSPPKVLGGSPVRDQSHVSTVNYESSKYMREPIFREPQPVGMARDRPRRSINRFTDKIDIDGNLLNGSETPSMNGFSYIPPPESPRLLPGEPRIKQEPDRYYLPSESPRDLLAHRLYEDRVAKNIRTPKSSTRSDSTKTPKDKLDKIF